MVEVVIDSVRVSLTNQQRIVVLKEVNAERYLPIWIGPYEAEAITIALQEIEIARPQTHDLVKNLIQLLNARLVRVEVLELKDDVFYGNLVVELDGNTINIDARPSDALALAVRTNVPVMVSEQVMQIASVTPEEEDEEIGESDGGSTHLSKTEQGSEERLSVFEDFLENLDIDDEDNTSDNEEDDGEDTEK